MDAWDKGLFQEFKAAYAKCEAKNHFDPRLILANLMVDSEREGEEDDPLGTWWINYVSSCNEMSEYRRMPRKTKPVEEILRELQEKKQGSRE